METTFFDKVARTPAGKTALAGVLAIAGMVADGAEGMLNSMVSPAGAAEFASAVPALTPEFQKAWEALLKVIPPARLQEYQAFSSLDKQTVAFFYRGFKEAKPNDLAYQQQGVEHVIFLLAGYRKNQDSLKFLDDNKDNPERNNVVRSLEPVRAPIKALKANYATVVVDNPTYAPRFTELSDLAMADHQKAKPLNDAAASRPSPELVAARQGLATEKQKLAEQKKVNAALDQVLATARRH